MLLGLRPSSSIYNRKHHSINLWKLSPVGPKGGRRPDSRSTVDDLVLYDYRLSQAPYYKGELRDLPSVVVKRDQGKTVEKRSVKYLMCQETVYLEM